MGGVGALHDAALNRMADLDFIAELLTLLRHGITDKKIHVDRFYDDTEFTEENAASLHTDFNAVVDRISALNEALHSRGRDTSNGMTSTRFSIGSTQTAMSCRKTFCSCTGSLYGSMWIFHRPMTNAFRYRTMPSIA